MSASKFGLAYENLIKKTARETIPPYNRIQLSSRSNALYERAILKTLKGRRIIQSEIKLTSSKTRLLYKNVSHPKPHISVRFNLFKHKVKEWLVYGLLTYAFIVPCLKSLATVDFDDFIDGVDCQSVRALMPELFVANDARQHATLSKWFDATCEAVAYLFTYCWKGHTPPLAYHPHSYLFDFGLTIDERRYYMGQLFGNEKADQFAQHDSWRQVQILMQSTIAFIANHGAKSYPKIKEEIERRFNGEVKMTEVDVIKEKILFRNLIALVAIGGVWRQVRRLVHGRITRHPQNHCLDSLMVTKAMEPGRGYLVKLDYYNQPASPSAFSITSRQNTANAFLANPFKMSFNPFMWRDIYMRPVVSETHNLRRLTATPATDHFASVLESARPKHELKGMAFSLNKFNYQLTTSLTEQLFDRKGRNSNMDIDALHFMYLHRLVCDFTEHYAFLAYYEELIAENLNADLPAYLKPGQAADSNRLGSGPSVDVAQIEKSKSADIIGALRQDIDITKPLKSINDKLYQAASKCSADLLTTAEWHAFLREIASHESITRNDLDYLKESRNIYEAKYRLDTILIAISQRIYERRYWRALRLLDDDDLTRHYHYCTIPLMNHNDAAHTDLLALDKITTTKR